MSINLDENPVIPSLLAQMGDEDIDMNMDKLSLPGDIGMVVSCLFCRRVSKKDGGVVSCVHCEESITSLSQTVRNGFIHMRDALGIVDDKDNVIDTAALFFIRAVDNMVTQHYKTELIQASCLYSTCRERNLSLLLIDFSNYLGVSVHNLGFVHLELCETLEIDEYECDRMLLGDIAESQKHEKLIDPSIFITCFSNCLFKGGTHDGVVVRTAKEIIATRKSDWIQTRQHSYICREALYTAALSHGVKCSDTYMENVLRICQEANVMKQLEECTKTESQLVNISGGPATDDRAPQISDSDFNLLLDMFNPPRSSLLIDNASEIMFLLGEAVKRALEANSLIEAALSDTKLNQRSREWLEMAQKEIIAASFSLTEASDDVGKADSNPAGWGTKKKRGTTRKKRTTRIIRA